MKAQYRLFRRNGIFYAQDNVSGKQQSLKTRIRQEALSLLQAKNQAHSSASFTLELGLVYLRHANPKLAMRVWHNLECERQRLDEAHRTFARDFDQAVNEASRSSRVEALVSAYALQQHMRSRQRDMEMELEL